MASDDSWENSYYSESLGNASSSLSETSSHNKSNEDPNHKNCHLNESLYDKNGSNSSSNEECEETNDSSVHDRSQMFAARKTKILDFSTTSEEEEDNGILSSEENTKSLTRTKDFLAEEDSESIGNTSVQIIESVTSSEAEEDNDIIDASTDEGIPIYTPKKQVTLPQMLENKNDQNINTQQKQISDAEKITECDSSERENSIIVSQDEYNLQHATLKSLQEEKRKIQNILWTVNLPALPDKGEALLKKQQSLDNAVKLAEIKFKKMVVNEALTTITKTLPKPATWEDLQVMSEAVQPKTFGDKAIATIENQKMLTMERLQQLHNSLTSCPTEDTFAEEPKGLKVELMPHQKYALAWLLWREAQRPSGGILADDMGLGKTLTMISLVLKSREIKKSLDDVSDSDEENREELSSKYNGGTLVVCPASLLKQWEAEVEKHCRRYLLSVELYHGPRREPKPKTLAKRDIVITTYAICMYEFEKDSPLRKVRWRRIILDEAHQVRNYKSQTSKAVCELFAQSRWVLTGTPVHNKEEDMYSLLKFLRCSPFDNLVVWKRWVGNKKAGGQDRLNTVLASIMLRRTKIGLQEKGALQSLPDRHFETISINLQAQEQAVYQKILIFSRKLFAQYLHQHAENQNSYVPLGNCANPTQNPQDAYFQMHQKLLNLNKVREVKSHEILVLLLRLRQMCCHPSLVVKMMHSDQLESESDIEGREEFDILKEMEKLNIDNNPNHDALKEKDNNEEFNTALTELLNPNNPLFLEDRRSTKLEAVIKLLQEKILPTDEKAIVVSQWASLLRLLGVQLKESNILFDQLDGSVTVTKRMTLVNNFNSPSYPTKILLLSLTAGGVGLNLTGANHMVLLDLHWNPQLEMQAQDRIYRVGQKRDVHIYKFMVVNTIEERIKKLQDVKISMADSMLTGSKRQNMKLTLQDLRMLFNM